MKSMRSTEVFSMLAAEGMERTGNNKHIKFTCPITNMITLIPHQRIISSGTMRSILKQLDAIKAMRRLTDKVNNK